MDKLKLAERYTVLCEDKSRKYGELKKQHESGAAGAAYSINTRIKIDRDMYNIHFDILILLSEAILIPEMDTGDDFAKETVEKFAGSLRNTFPNIPEMTGMSGKKALNNELKNTADALADKVFGHYIKDEESDYDSEETHTGKSPAGPERKIKELSALHPVYSGGIRRRNTAHIIPFSEYDGRGHNLNILALCPVCHSKFAKIEEKRQLYDDIAVNRHEHMSVETRLLNRTGTNLNVTAGLCVGHDSLFCKYSEAYVTTLVAKDRVTGSNPAAPLYTAESYCRKKLLTENPDESPGH